MEGNETGRPFEGYLQFLADISVPHSQKRPAA